MIETTYRTSDLPAAERFGYWYELASRFCGTPRIRSLGQAAFHAEGRSLDFGSMGALTSDKSAFTIVRTPAEVRREDQERCQLTLLEQGAVRYEERDRQTALGPGEFVLHSSALPSVTSSVTRGRSTILHFPASLLPPSALPLLATGLSAREGLGALVAGTLRELAALPADRGAEAPRLGRITLDLLSALCHRELGTLTPANTTPATLLGQLRAFIQRRLADPDLTPAAIAEAHHISVRYLHRLFQQENQTVAGWIRELRLEHCRRDLADPGWNDHPAHALGRRWGYLDSAHFSRAFRGAFGLPPGEYRRLAQLSAPVSGPP